MQLQTAIEAARADAAPLEERRQQLVRYVPPNLQAHILLQRSLASSCKVHVRSQVTCLRKVRSQQKCSCTTCYCLCLIVRCKMEACITACLAACRWLYRQAATILAWCRTREREVQRESQRHAEAEAEGQVRNVEMQLSELASKCRPCMEYEAAGKAAALAEVDAAIVKGRASIEAKDANTKVHDCKAHLNATPSQSMWAAANRCWRGR